MRKAAEVGRVSFTHIGDLREVKPRMDALFAKLEQPALTDIRVGWPLAAGKRIDVYPTPLPDLYAGEPVTFAARLEGVDLDALHGELLVTGTARSEEHTSELQSLMRISYAVFCLKKKQTHIISTIPHTLLM